MISEQLSILIQVDGKRIKRSFGHCPSSKNSKQFYHHLSDIIIELFTSTSSNWADTGLGSNLAFGALVISTVVLTNLQLVSH